MTKRGWQHRRQGQEATTSTEEKFASSLLETTDGIQRVRVFACRTETGDSILWVKALQGAVPRLRKRCIESGVVDRCAMQARISFVQYSQNVTPWRLVGGRSNTRVFGHQWQKTSARAVSAAPYRERSADRHEPCLTSFASHSRLAALAQKHDKCIGNAPVGDRCQRIAGSPPTLSK